MAKPWSLLIVDKFDRPESTWEGISKLVGAGGVTVTNCPESAERALDANTFDLILCSYRFPEEENGTAFISRLRARGQQTPVIFISASMNSHGLMEAAAIPSADFLAAPFSIDDLKERIQLLCP